MKIIYTLPFLFTLFLFSGIDASADSFKEVVNDSPILEENMEIQTTGNYVNTYYKIDLKEDSTIQFNLSDHFDMVAYVRIVVDDGSEYGKTIADFNNYNNQKLSKFTMQLKAGTYYLSLSNHDIFKLSYSLSPLTSKYDVEPNNTIEMATPIEFGTLIQNTGNIMGENDYYVFTLTEKSIITLSTDNFRSDDSGTLNVSIKDQEGNGYIGLMVYGNYKIYSSEILLPGTYYVNVYAHAQSLITNYEFKVDQQIINSDEHYKNSIFSTDLSPNEKVKGILSQNDEYNISIPTDQKVNINITNKDGILMDATVKRVEEDGSKTEIYNYAKYDDKGTYTISPTLKAGNYVITVDTRYYEGTSDLVFYTISYNDVTYPDVTPSIFSYKEIMYLSLNGIIQGYPDGTFKPKNPITRRQVFTMLSRDLKINLTRIREDRYFPDIGNHSADYNLIIPFYNAGIIDGYTDGSIGLNDNLTRGQLAKILVNTYKLKLKEPIQPFNDVSKNHFAYDAIQILASNGIALGYNGKFNPSAPVTREEFSLFLYRIFIKHEQTK